MCINLAYFDEFVSCMVLLLDLPASLPIRASISRSSDMFVSRLEQYRVDFDSKVGNSVDTNA